MNLEQFATNYLTERGLWPHEAVAVIDAYVKGDFGNLMADRMNYDISDYPPQLFPAVTMGLDAEAARWLEANAPRHLARGMFPGPEGAR